MSKLKVAVGVATEREPGWLALSQSELDLTCEADWLARFQPGSMDNILAEHVWEHLTWTQATAATALCFRFLKPGGCLRLAVPDTLHASAFIVDAVSATGSLAHEHNHLVDYNWRLMNKLLSAAGFEVRLGDWWDEQGIFHNDYAGNDGNGYVMRSYANWPKHASIYREPETYQRLIDGVPESLRADFVRRGIEHTSLVIDGIKPQLAENCRT